MHDALIILGHGSRAPDAAADMERVAAGLRQRHPQASIRVAHMELCEPTLEQVVAACVAEGRRSLLVLPYFLHRGNHLRDDIPTLIADLVRRHAGLRLVLGRHIGYADELVDIIDRRWRESAAEPTEPGTP